ncbi:hypothetical protein KM043_015259 [Ampulex compressa]|nr:hypothetical protein KM043_015259 [Ampulex compressa]
MQNVGPTMETPGSRARGVRNAGGRSGASSMTENPPWIVTKYTILLRSEFPKPQCHCQDSRSTVLENTARIRIPILSSIVPSTILQAENHVPSGALPRIFNQYRHYSGGPSVSGRILSGNGEDREREGGDRLVVDARGKPGGGLSAISASLARSAAQRGLAPREARRTAARLWWERWPVGLAEPSLLATSFFLSFARSAETMPLVLSSCTERRESSNVVLSSWLPPPARPPAPSPPTRLARRCDIDVIAP